MARTKISTLALGAAGVVAAGVTAGIVNVTPADAKRLCTSQAISPGRGNGCKTSIFNDFSLSMHAQAKKTVGGGGGGYACVEIFKSDAYDGHDGVGQTNKCAGSKSQIVLQSSYYRLSLGYGSGWVSAERDTKAHYLTVASYGAAY